MSKREVRYRKTEEARIQMLVNESESLESESLEVVEGGDAGKQASYDVQNLVITFGSLLALFIGFGGF